MCDSWIVLMRGIRSTKSHKKSQTTLFIQQWLQLTGHSFQPSSCLSFVTVSYASLPTVVTVAAAPVGLAVAPSAAAVALSALAVALSVTAVAPSVVVEPATLLAAGLAEPDPGAAFALAVAWAPLAV
jgi:hypothetical protein